MKFIGNNWKRVLLFLLLGIAVGYIAWIFIVQKPKNNGKKVSTYTAKRGTLKQTLIISGTLDAEEKVTLRFNASGYISWIGVKLGDYVKKGQVIAKLDDRELKKTLGKYLNTYMSERWDFEQEKDEYRQPAQKYWGLTWDQRNEVDRALEKAQFDLNSSVLDVELKELALKWATLITPIEGVVTSIKSPLAGVHVTAVQAEIEVTNPKTIYFSLLPDQTEVVQLSEDLPATIILDSYPDIELSGVVKRISFTPQAGETNTVYEVKLLFPFEENQWEKYRIGMTGDVTFTVQEKHDILAVPTTFVKTEKDKKYVMKKGEKKNEKVYVETGIESDQMTEITGGLAEGDVIYD